MIAIPPAALWLALALTTGDDQDRSRNAEELARHQGTWAVTRFVRDGKESPAELVNSIVRIVDGDHVVWKRDGKSFAGTKVELDPAADPKTIDVLPDGGPSFGKRVLGIYKMDGDVLTICMADPEKPRPDGFQAGEGSGRTLMTFRRQAMPRSSPGAR